MKILHRKTRVLDLPLVSWAFGWTRQPPGWFKLVLSTPGYLMLLHILAQVNLFLFKKF